MLGKRRVAWVLWLVVADVATLVLCFLAAYELRVALNRPLGRAAGSLAHYLWLLELIVPLWIALLAAAGAYGVDWLGRSRAWLAFRVSALGLLLLTGALFLSQEADVNRSLLLLVALSSGLGLWMARGAFRAWLRRLRRDERWVRQALVVGTDERAERLITALQQYPEAGWAVRGCVSLKPSEHGRTPLGIPIVGSLDDLPALLLEGRTVVDEVFFATSLAHLDDLAEALEACEQLGVDTRVMADFHRPAYAHPFVEELFGLPFYGFSPSLTRQSALTIKRAVDLLGASVLLVVTLPLLAVLALGIKITSAGPVLFHQDRAGLHGRRFRMHKLRTMVVGAEDLRAQVVHLNRLSGPVFKALDDPRVTRLGRLLRRFSLDELPQFWNVVKGDMSLVGPRPLPLYEAARLKGAQRRRLARRPGVTGLWQVSRRSSVDFEEWMRLDLEYVDRWSLWLDLKVLARTMPAVLRGELPGGA